MNLHAELQLGDGATAVAPFGADRPAPARGALCLLRVDGLLEPARFVRLLPEGAPRPAAEPAEFVSEATRAEAERVAGNEEALLRVRAAGGLGHTEPCEYLLRALNAFGGNVGAFRRELRGSRSR